MDESPLCSVVKEIMETIREHSNREEDKRRLPPSWQWLGEHAGMWRDEGTGD